jgi:hypothetical protein
MESSLIENTNTSQTNNVITKKITSYTYVLVALVICLMVFLFYHAHCCFQANQGLNFHEPYINESPRDDPQDDNSFDVGKEVKKLIQMQEQFLEKLERARKGN